MQQRNLCGTVSLDGLFYGGGKFIFIELNGWCGCVAKIIFLDEFLFNIISAI